MSLVTDGPKITVVVPTYNCPSRSNRVSVPMPWGSVYAMNDYAGRRSGTNSDSNFFCCGGHHVANASNGQSRECKSCHNVLLSIVA